MSREIVKERTRNPDRTRAKLLEVAIAEFSKRGYHGVAVDDIVRKAGFNKRMVYHYFGSKKGIYQAAILEVYSWLARIETDVAAANSDPLSKLRNIFDAYFRFNGEYPEFSRILLWENLNKGMGIEGNERVLKKDPFVTRFREIIQEGIDEGLFRADLDVRHLLIQFIALCFIYYSNTYTLSQGVGMDLSDPKVLDDARKQALELIFDGILK